ncbi:MAG: hypothetical protein HC859_16985 [Bacteroidia bacterium]|nr:hypothetical protein [Bacteroidia bacterium]
MNAIILVIGGIVKLGRLISMVPNVVILGFMNGIAVLIWMDQLKKLLALSGNEIMEGGIAANLTVALGTFSSSSSLSGRCGVCHSSSMRDRL